MAIRATIITLATIFMAIALEHLPMPSLLSWLQPLWLLLVITVLILHAPQYFGLWLAIPLGFMMDVENNQLFGVHVITFGVHIVLLQLFYRRLQTFHFLQLTLPVALMVMLHQVLLYMAIALVGENRTPVPIWQPVLTSALVWPWLYAIVHMSIRRLNLS